MPRPKIVQAVVDAVNPPKKARKVVAKPTPVLTYKCDNCNDSGMTCRECRTGFDV